MASHRGRQRRYRAHLDRAAGCGGTHPPGVSGSCEGARATRLAHPESAPDRGRQRTAARCRCGEEVKPEAGLTAIDLCSGPGGVTTGYKAAGIRVLAAVDIDEDA